MQRVTDLLKRFRRDERGVFAIFFALIAVVLIAAAGAVVDFTRVQQARTRAQIAVDSAALALQAKIANPGVTAASLKLEAQALLTERIADSSVTAVVESATPNVNAGKLTITGYISVPTYFVQLVGIRDIRSQVLSEVTQSSSDLEVALSIDITGSMAKVTCGGQRNCTPSDKIGDLINASNTLIDLLVKDVQTPSYSKMAIVPWSTSANVGGYANAVRGAPTPGVSISAVTWFEGTSKSITRITRADPGVITISDNTTALRNNDWVYVSGVSGMTEINGTIGQITNLTTATSSTKTFTLMVDGSNLCTTSGCGYSKPTNNTGTIQRCLLPSCLERVTTATNHGIAANERVYVSGTSGTSGINGKTYLPNILSSSTYSLPDTGPSNGIRTSGGTSYCVVYGCEYYYFNNTSGGTSTYRINTCVTERTINPYNDTAPGSTPLGKHYTSGGGNCINNTIVPLTSSKSALHAAIGVHSPDSSRTLVASGATAGHIGLAWGWYMISPNFATLWPASTPRAYGSNNLIKAIIFMTDGVFNIQYCNGVATSQIDCSSPNGTSKSQAQALCSSIKTPSNSIRLYVVGFDLANDSTTLNFLRDCATDPQHFYRADTGADLVAAFQSIADNLSDLRISR